MTNICEVFCLNLLHIEYATFKDNSNVAIVCGAIDAELLPVEVRQVFMHEVRIFFALD